MRNTIFRSIVGTMLLMPAYALAAPEIELPATGQTGCWDGAGAAIQCAGTGQDGDIRAGVAWPDPRFIDNGNGTVTDTLTDLVWLKNADCYGALSWPEALQRGEELANGACDLTDTSTPGQWRVPNRNEMLSIVNYQANDGGEWLNSQGFANGVQGWYWTSDSYAPAAAAKWVIHSVGDALPDTGAGSQSNHVLFVRDLAGPQAAFNPASDDFGNVGVNQASPPRTITVSNTGAMPLAVSGITVAGTDAALFAVNPGDGTAGTCGSAPTLAAGSSCSVAVVFTPDSLGAKSAELSVASNSTGSPTGAVALAGTGVAVTHDVTAAITGENGSAEPTGAIQVEDGATTSFTLTPAAGYRADATVGGTCPAGSFSGATYTTGAITDNCTVEFSFVPLTFAISTVTSGNGTIVCTPGTEAQAGTEVTCTVTPAAGETISEVTVDGQVQAVSDQATFSHAFGPLDADHSIGATFSGIAFTVSFASSGNGSVVGTADQSVGYNGSATEVTAVPASGYHFVNWTSDNGFTSTENPLVVAGVTANQAITANFAPNPAEADFLADMVRAFQSAMGKRELSTEEKARCDIAPLGLDGKPAPDGVVNVGDVVILLRRLVGLVTW